MRWFEAGGLDRLRRMEEYENCSEDMIEDGEVLTRLEKLHD